jgi:hypothetical protein
MTTLHPPNRKHLSQQFLCCCLCIRSRGNLFTEPLPSNGCLIWLHYAGLEASCHIIIIISYKHWVRVRYTYFTYGVFNDAQEYTASNDDWWIMNWKVVERSDHSVIWNTVPEFAWGTEKQEKPCQRSRSPRHQHFIKDMIQDIIDFSVSVQLV